MKQVTEIRKRNITIHDDTHSRLNDYGGITDSFDSVINGIVDWAEEKGLDKNVLQQYMKGVQDIPNMSKT